MNVYTILSLIATILTFGLGLFVFFKTQRNPLTLVFFLFTIALGLLSLSQFQMRNATGFQEAWLWSKVFAMWPLTLALSVHFVLELNQNKQRGFLFFSLLYLPGLAFSYIQFSTDFIALAPVETYWGWSISYHYGIWHKLAMIYGISYWLISIIVPLIYYKTFIGKAKKQALLIVIGYSFNFIITLASDVLFPMYKINIPELGNTADIIPIALIGFAIWRYDMFTLSIDPLSDKLFTSISNYLLLVDEDKQILEINQNLLLRLNYSHQEVVGQKLGFLLDWDHQNANPLSKHITQSSEFRNKEILFRTKAGQAVPLNFSASRINDLSHSKQKFIYVGIEDRLNSFSRQLISENKKQIEFLAEAALDLVGLKTKEEVYEYISEKLYNLLEKKAIVVNTEFHDNNGKNSWEIKTLKGIGSQFQDLSKLLGFDPSKMRASAKIERYSSMVEGKINLLELDFDNLTGGLISNETGETAKRLFGINKLYSIYIQQGDHIYGTTSILTRDTTPPLNNELIESFMSIASMVLNRQYIEAELAKSEKLFRSIVESSQISIFIIDAEGKFVLANGKHLNKLGIQPKEIIGKSIFDLYSKYPIILNHVRHALQGNTFREVIGIKNILYYNVNFTPLTDDTGKVTAIVCMADDVTSRIKSEKNLENLSEMQTKLFKVIGHDLKSPLANILSYSDLIISDFDSFEKYEIRHFIQNIQKAGQNGYQILDDLLEWSKSVQSKTPIYLEKSCLKAKVIIAVQQVQPFANKKNIQITNTLQDDIPIIADKNMVITVLRNILSNAIKFTNPNGHIQVHSHHDMSHVYLSISDNGIGISEDQLIALFDDTIKKPSRGTEGETGSGLGLKICKGFIEQSGGEITVQSKLNEGSVFTLSFPIPFK